MSFEPRNYHYQRLSGQGENAANYVVAMAPRGGRVLELGAGPGSITRRLKHEAECSVTAVELVDEFLPYLEANCTHVVQANLNADDWRAAIGEGERFEAIIAADILEHLENPSRLLAMCPSLLAEGGSIIISLPHIGHCVIHACLMDENFEYRDWGLLDATHIRFFGLKNMQDLIEGAGLKVVEVRFVCRMPEDTEFSELWRKAPNDLKNAVVRNPFAYVYQCVLRAVPIGAPEMALKIIEQASHQPGITTAMWINRMLKRYLPKRMYYTCRRLYGYAQKK